MDVVVSIAEKLVPKRACTPEFKRKWKKLKKDDSFVSGCQRRTNCPEWQNIKV